MMILIDSLLSQITDGAICDIRVGASWTAVEAHVAGERRCGLATSFSGHRSGHHGRPRVADAGNLTGFSPTALVQLARSDSPMEIAIGLAAINALLPRQPALWAEEHAADVIAHHGKGKRVVLVGHFPFVDQLRERVGTLWVLELQPQAGDLPASAAVDVVPRADVLAITSTAFINRTFAGLMALRRRDALVMLLGPSTPLSPVLFDYGVHFLSGAIVQDVDRVLQAVSQGANFRQVRRSGVQLVTMSQIVP
ncbi:MAG: DUF364 domain-containing protein [Chloroflexota bacterium]|nr:DUF364 domain-containing protein [Chloroflexota bacterium]